MPLCITAETMEQKQCVVLKRITLLAGPEPIPPLPIGLFIVVAHEWKPVAKYVKRAGARIEF